MYHTDIIRWYEHVRLRNMAHMLAAQRAERLYSYIGFLAIIAGILAGYEIVKGEVANEQAASGWWSEYWPYIVGIFAIVAALSNAAVKFFGFETRKELNRNAAIQYASLQYEIERRLMVPGMKIPEDVYDYIANQLSEIDKKAPLTSEKINDRALKKINSKTSEEIPFCHSYDVELWETHTIEDGVFKEIPGNPVRSYVCEPLRMCEYKLKNEITVDDRLIMERDGNEYSNEISGRGVIDNNIGFLQYSIQNFDNSNVTYGTMVLNFTNRVQAEGYWMTAGVKGAVYLVGRISMTLRS